MTFKDKIIIYLYNKGNELEVEKESVKNQRRYEVMDSLDLYENMRADIRIESLNEIIRDLIRILVFCDPKNKT